MLFTLKNSWLDVGVSSNRNTIASTIWGFSDNGSTVALQASGKGSIPLTSTK